MAISWSPIARNARRRTPRQSVEPNGRSLPAPNQHVVPVRSISRNKRIRALPVAQMAQQKMAVDAVPFGLAQHDEVRRVEFKDWRQVERYDVMGDEETSSATTRT